MQDLAFTAGGNSPRHTVQALPEHLVAAKVSLGHRQAMPELVNMLVHKGKEEGERREERGGEAEEEGEKLCF